MSDAYKVGIKLLMQSNHAQVLGMLSQQLLGVNATVNQLTGNFGKLKLAVGGALSIYGGEKMLRMMGGLVEHGSKIVHQQEMLRIAGVRNLEVVEATRRAYEVSGRVQTTTISENLKHIGELRYAFGSMQQATQYIERVSQANTVLNSIKGGGKDEIWSMVKALEEKGITTNGDEFMRYVDLMTKAVAASRGKVTPSQFFNAFKYGRTSMLGWDETFIGQYLPRAIQSFVGTGGGGGQAGGPGSALMSSFAAIVQGQMNKFPAEEFRRLGLVDSFQGIPGSSKSIASISGRRLFQRNPYEWVQSVLMPQLAANGVTSDAQIQEQVGRLFPNRTAGHIMTMFALQGRFREGEHSPWEKDAAMARQAMSTLRGFQELMKNDPTTAMRAFHAQWESLKEALGFAAVGPAMMGMRSLTNGITALTKSVGAHPDAVKGLLVGFGTLATLLVGAGGIAILAALGPTGWLIAGLSALAAILTAVYPTIHQIIGDGNKVKNRTKHNPGESPLHWWNRKTHKGVDWDAVPGSGKPMSWPKTVFGPNGEIVSQGTVNVNQPNVFKRLQQWLGGDKPKPPGEPILKPFIELRPPVEKLNRNIERLNHTLERTGGLDGDGAALPPNAKPRMYSGGGGGLSPSAFSGGFGAIPAAPFAGGGSGSGGISIPHIDGGGSAQKSKVKQKLASLGVPLGGATGGKTPLVGPMGQKVALSLAMQHLGENEHANRSTLAAYFRKHGFHVDPATTAWCATFVNSSLHGAGIKGTGSNVATSFMKWGNPVADLSKVQAGDVLVQHRGRRPGQTGGHVGFATGLTRMRNGQLQVEMLSGNSSDMVKKGWYNSRALIGRRATEESGAIPPPASKNIHMNHTSILDGRVVARSTMKHIVGWGNGPTRAPRLHDPLSSAPIPV